MKIDDALKDHVTAAFDPLNNQAAAGAFPAPGALASALEHTLSAGSTAGTKNVKEAVAKMFTTAAVDMWLRAVHSFLVSASLTDVSPIWASVAGYYSSHYSVRAIAHLLGFFQLFVRKRIVRLKVVGGQYVCSFTKKTKWDREHRFYWRTVKVDPHFSADPFFTENPAQLDTSDVGHRDRANYLDHLPSFPTFRPLSGDAVRTRIQRISDIQVSSPPIPRLSQYPDVDAVQIMAYHRLVRFRDLVDAIIGGDNRFWNVHRNPSWAREFLDYQLTEEAATASRFFLQ